MNALQRDRCFPAERDEGVAGRFALAHGDDRVVRNVVDVVVKEDVNTLAELTRRDPTRFACARFLNVNI